MSSLQEILFIVGLGNPGEGYRHTFHSLGRELIERIASDENLKWKKGADFDRTEGSPACVRLHCFMNLSGEPVAKLLQRAGGSPQSLLVCYDDFALPLGRIRIRRQGSAGGHNGLKSIIAYLGSEDFPRLRLGIGEPEGLPPGREMKDYVLGRPAPGQREAVERMIVKAMAALRMIREEGIEKAMNVFNKSDEESS